MIIYIDSDYKCHTEYEEGMEQIDVELFDGKCKKYIEGFRFVPSGRSWKREDGIVFNGEMVTCWRDYEVLREIQEAYEEGLDMRAALEVLEVTE